MYLLSDLLNISLQNIQKTVSIVVVFLSTMIGFPANKQLYTQDSATPSGEVTISQESDIPTPTTSPRTREVKTLEVTPSSGSARPTPTLTSQQPKNESETGVVLRNIIPSSVNFGDIVTLIGQNFGASSGNVWFSNTRGVNYGTMISRWSDTEIAVSVPQFTGNQKVNVQVETTDQGRSNIVEVTIIEGQPIISSLTPQNPIIGGQLSIRGSGFGSANGTVNIYEPDNINNPLVSCQITRWTETEITCAISNERLINKEYGIEVITGSNRKSSWVYTTFACDPSGCG